MARKKKASRPKSKKKRDHKAERAKRQASIVTQLKAQMANMGLAVERLQSRLSQYE